MAVIRRLSQTFGVLLWRAVTPRTTDAHATRWRRTLLIAGLLLAIAAVVALSVATRLTPHLRNRVVSALNARFESEVALESLQVGVFPTPEVSGGGLVLAA